MLAALASIALTLSDPATVQVEPLKFDVAAIRDAKKVEVRVTERGQRVVYKGVPLRSLLLPKLDPAGGMVSLRSMADRVILVRAGDGYQAALSAAAVAMDERGERFLLALERDGKPLDDKQGPVKLIVPNDPEHVRWVRMVASIDLVEMPPAKKK